MRGLLSDATQWLIGVRMKPSFDGRGVGKLKQSLDLVWNIAIQSLHQPSSSNHSCTMRNHSCRNLRDVLFQFFLIFDLNGHWQKGCHGEHLDAADSMLLQASKINVLNNFQNASKNDANQLLVCPPIRLIIRDHSCAKTSTAVRPRSMHGTRELNRWFLKKYFCSSVMKVCKQYISFHRNPMSIKQENAFWNVNQAILRL